MKSGSPGILASPHPPAPLAPAKSALDLGGEQASVSQRGSHN